MYIKSWNAKGYTKIYTTINSIGHFVGKTENPTTFRIEFSNDEEGIKDSLYCPNNELVSACWLTSPSARGTERMMFVSYNKIIDGGTCNDPQTLSYGIRPVVCLKNEVIGTINDSVIIEQ